MGVDKVCYQYLLTSLNRLLEKWTNVVQNGQTSKAQSDSILTVRNRNRAAGLTKEET